MFACLADMNDGDETMRLWQNRQFARVNDQLAAAGSHTQQLDRLFDELDAVVAAHSWSAWKRAANTRLGSVAAIRPQVDFYFSVASKPSVRTVCEVGFNAGHSAALWLSAKPSIRVVTFDLLGFPYSAACLSFLKDRFPGRLAAHRGDSAIQVRSARVRLYFFDSTRTLQHTHIYAIPLLLDFLP